MIYADGGRDDSARTATTNLEQQSDGQRSSDGSASPSSGRSRRDSTPPSSPYGTSQSSIQSESSHAKAPSSSSVAAATSSVAPAFHLRDRLHSSRRTKTETFEPTHSGSSSLPRQPSVRRRFGFARLRLPKGDASTPASTPQSPMSPSPIGERFPTSQGLPYATRSKENSNTKHRLRSPSTPIARDRMTPGTEASAHVPLIRARGASASAHQGHLDGTVHTVPPMPLRPSKSIPDSTLVGDLRFQYNTILPSSPRPRAPKNFSKTGHSARGSGGQSRPNGYSQDEIRASFKSALTTSSSIAGASTTEASSILTHESPSENEVYSCANEFFPEDEGMTVEEAIDMYGAGFTDDPATDSETPALISPEPYSSVKSLGTKETATLAPHQMLGALRPSSPELRASAASMAGQSRSGMPQRSLLEAVVPRDRYGFRKVTQYVTVAQYDAWNVNYTQHLDRRKTKWQTLLKEFGLATDHPIRFPAKSDKMKRYIRKGIPPEYRAAAWWWYAGGQARMQKHPGLYQDLLQKAHRGQMSESDKELIERDLHRTFPDNSRFKPDPTTTADSADGPQGGTGSGIADPEMPILRSLRRVLQTFSIQNPKIGYCQSLNFLAGLLLLFMDEEKAFWMLTIITHVYLPGTHEVNLEGANVDLGVLMTSIKESMPAVWSKVGGELDGSAGDGRMGTRLPPISLCATAWFMSCFIGTLPIETVLRVWDSFFYEGSKTLFRIALSIFKVGEAEIRGVNDSMEIFLVVQTIPRRLIDANALMEACFKRRNGFGHLSQETIDERRRQWRKLYAQERATVAAGALPSLERSGTGMKGLLRRADSKRRLRNAQLVG
ncbi:MAG: hypothetical protein M1812_000410 [Candelaria pacifica]|nr:MAG: hypothetical protein M1812_000410 [Candelaria pacifica]